MELTPEILKERKTGIGGSDCAAVLGLSKWSTPLDIYLSKIDPDSQPIEQNGAMKWGHILEPVIVKEYENVTNQKVEQPDKIFRNEKYNWLLANVDGIVSDKLLLEVKTTKFFNENWGEEGTDEIPQEYLIQVAHYCAVLDRQSVDIAALGSGSDFRIYHYERNKVLEEKIIELTHQFWYENVQKMTPPEPVNNDDIIKLYRRGDESKVLQAGSDIVDMVYAHKDMKKQIKTLEEQGKSLESKIKGAMKENAYLADINGEVLASWTNQTSNRFQSKDFKSANADLYNQFCKASESRVFRNKIK